MHRFLVRSLVFSAALIALSAPSLAMVKGRAYEPGKRLRLNATVGQVSPIEGFVQETTRRLFEVTGQPERQAGAESFSLEDVGIRDSETTYGLSMEYMWKYVTLQVDGSYMRAEATGTASRDFFIGVKEIRFGGQEYEYQVILEGTPYHADLDAALVGFRIQFTPVTFNPGGVVQFVPWAHLGLFGFSGQFNVQAGPALGVIEYENPAREYVQNGRGDGEVTALVPEIGLGGELRFKLAPRAGSHICLVLQGGYSIFDFEGSTSDLGISSRNEKDLDVDYDSYDARALIEWPLSAKVNLLVGVEYRTVRAKALSQAKDRPIDETLELREKFDKSIDLEMTSANAIVGLRW